jgi:hypothetical protein
MNAAHPPAEAAHAVSHLPGRAFLLKTLGEMALKVKKCDH